MSSITKNVFPSDPFYVESRGLDVKEPEKKKAKKEEKVNEVLKDQVFNDLPKTIQPGFEKIYSYGPLSEEDAVSKISQLISSIYSQYLEARPEKKFEGIFYYGTPESFFSHETAQAFGNELQSLIIKGLTPWGIIIVRCV